MHCSGLLVFGVCIIYCKRLKCPAVDECVCLDHEKNYLKRTHLSWSLISIFRFCTFRTPNSTDKCCPSSDAMTCADIRHFVEENSLVSVI